MWWRGCCARASGSTISTPQAARAHVRDQVPDADPEDLLLLDDLLGIARSRVRAARRRRRRPPAPTDRAGQRCVAGARPTPGVYVIEDAHWIDDVSESMLADFLAVVPQTHSLMLITYRPEYRVRWPDAGRADDRAATIERCASRGADRRVAGRGPIAERLAERIAERAAGNPFFAEEIVRDLAERGVLDGEPGAYTLRGDVDEVSVPATLQATIGARIDRLDAAAKRTLNAAAVIGSRFDADLLASLGIDAGARRADRGGTGRSGAVHPARRIRVSASADPHGGLRIATQIRPRRAAPAAGRRDRAARPGVARRERRPDRRASRGGRRSARGVRLAHAGRNLVDQPRHHGGPAQLAKGTAGRR